MSSIPKPISFVKAALTTAPEVPAALVTTNGNPAAPQENVDVEEAAAQYVGEAMKDRSELQPQVVAKRKTGSATKPNTPARRFRKLDIFSFIVNKCPENVRITGASAYASEEKARPVSFQSTRGVFCYHKAGKLLKIPKRQR